MAALTAATSRRTLSSVRFPVAIVSGGVKPGTKLVKKQLCAIEVSSGLVVNPTATTGLRGFGVALETWDNTAGTTPLHATFGVDACEVDFNGSAPVRADVGKPVYFYDNNTVSLSSNSGARSHAGYVAEVRDDGNYIFPVSPVDSIADRSLVAAMLASGAIESRHITAATLAGRLRRYITAGRNNTGNITVSGLTAGDVIWAVTQADDDAANWAIVTPFTTTIATDNTLVQTSASDLSAVKYLLDVVKVAS